MLKKITLKDHEGNKIVPTKTELANKLNEVIEVVNTDALQESKFEEDYLDDIANDFNSNFNKDEEIDIDLKHPFVVIDVKHFQGVGDEAELCALLQMACRDMINCNAVSKKHMLLALNIIKDDLMREE